MNEKNFGTQGVDAQGLGSQFPTFWLLSGPVVFDILNQKKLKMTISSLLFVYWWKEIKLEQLSVRVATELLPWGKILDVLSRFKVVIKTLSRLFQSQEVYQVIFMAFPSIQFETEFRSCESYAYSGPL